MRSITIALYLIALGIQPALCNAAKLEILLQEKQFVYKDKSVEDIDIKKGDTVTFKNNDTIDYQISSKSEVKPFKLGVMKPGVAKPIMFNKIGEVEVECALHSEMYLKITVK